MTRNTRRRLQWTVDTAKAMLSRAPQAILAQYARDNAEDTLHELDRMAPEIAQELQPRCEATLTLDESEAARVPGDTFAAVLAAEDATLLQQSAMAARLIVALMAEGVTP